MRHLICALALAFVFSGCGGEQRPATEDQAFAPPAAEGAAGSGVQTQTAEPTPGVSEGTTAPAPAAAPAAGSKVRVAFVTNNASDFWKIAEAGTEKAAQDLGVDVLFRIPSAGTAEQQQQIVQDLVTTGVSGIAISPKDPQNQTEMLNEAASQVNLITQDSDAPGSNRLCYIGTNNFEAGKEAGKLVQQCTPMGLPYMVFVGSMDAQNAQDRLKGLQEQLKESEYILLEVRTDEGDRAKAVANVEDALTKHPEVACYVGLWSYNGPAILNAVKNAHRQGEVKIVCFDEEEETLQGVKDGFIFGTVVQRPYEFGYQSVKVLKELAQGNKASIPENKQVYIPTLSVTQSNVDAFWAELKQQTGKT
ncbi:MAG: sugar-binding protein [Candidatus Hydrogenedentes bacterium]|nr:sugar-binding protein [Candidatus Hydrogenedentota bacterium]